MCAEVQQSLWEPSSGRDKTRMVASGQTEPGKAKVALVFQVLGQPIPDGIGVHALLSKEACPFVQWPGQVVGDGLVCCQLFCHC